MIKVVGIILDDLNGLCLLFFFFLTTIPRAYGSSHARGVIRAAAADLYPSHSHAGSELRL